MQSFWSVAQDHRFNRASAQKGRSSCRRHLPLLPGPRLLLATRVPTPSLAKRGSSPSSGRQPSHYCQATPACPRAAPSSLVHVTALSPRACPSRLLPFQRPPPLDSYESTAATRPLLLAPQTRSWRALAQASTHAHRHCHVRATVAPR